MKYYIASDHAGYKLKDFVITLLKNKGHEVVDLGPDSTDRVDYPDFAGEVCKSIIKDEYKSFGVLICGSGIGMSMSANKYDGIRAALCHNEYSASMARNHNDANVICLGERVSAEGMVESIINHWCEASFEGGRHAGRVEKINLLGSCRR
ncbi:MAG: ribose 5-phosphate isomerase B [Arcobacteraceae bacterium]|nr:ribose 5-phosphate isomerase B [Arcobacteraceae bacterium]